MAHTLSPVMSVPLSSAADKNHSQHLGGHHLHEEHLLPQLWVGPAGTHHRQYRAAGAQCQLGVQAAGRPGPRSRVSAPQSKRL